MASIEDWAAKTARRIVDEYNDRRIPRKDEAHVAAIVATFAEPLVALLRESHRSHYHCDDNWWYCCGKCTHGDHVMCPGGDDHEHDASCYLPSCYTGSHDGEASRTSGVCNCGADAWNARVAEVLNGRP